MDSMPRAWVFLLLVATRVLPGDCGVGFTRPPAERDIGGTVRYRVDGHPLNGIKVTAELTDRLGRPECLWRSGVTDRDGHFRIRVPADGMHYRVGVNLTQAPMPEYPFPPTFYPGAPDRESATLIKVPNETPPEDLNILVPGPLRTRSITILVTWPDGTPAADQYVRSSSTEGSTTGAKLPTDQVGLATFEGVENTEYVFQTQFMGGNDLKKVVHAEPVTVPAGQDPARVHLVLSTAGYYMDHHR
jgi:hypothetical protein